jgi:L-amino acid N-acyltransferase
MVFSVIIVIQTIYSLPPKSMYLPFLFTIRYSNYKKLLTDTTKGVIFMLNIRDAVEKDLQEILMIYNEAIRRTVATFDTEPRSLEKQKVWFNDHGPSHPIIVAEIDRKVIGWASLSRWSDRSAYDGTVELSFYILEAHQGKGIGKALLLNILERAKKLPLHTVISRITEGNEASIHLHKNAGFEYIGVMKKVGKKFGRLLDVHMFQIFIQK